VDDRATKWLAAVAARPVHEETVKAKDRHTHRQTDKDRDDSETNILQTIDCSRPVKQNTKVVVVVVVVVVVAVVVVVIVVVVFNSSGGGGGGGGNSGSNSSSSCCCCCCCCCCCSLLELH